MASCTQIDSMVQALTDGELGDSERVIVEQHVGECKSCAGALRRHQRTAALLFEALGEDRLARNLRQPILDHLPEMRPLRVDIEGVNWREKAPKTKNRWMHLVPAFAAAAVLSLAGLLYIEWPQGSPLENTAIGVVTHSMGTVRSTESDTTERAAAEVKDFVGVGQRFETGQDSSLMLTLRGQTQVKIAENTRVRVYDDRQLTVETGRAWFDVSRDERLFRVTTPTGDITVFGTTFDVKVDSGKTVVTVGRGTVQVENGIRTSELKPGDQVDLVMGQEQLQPRQIDPAAIMQWADNIVPDQEASDLFAKTVVPVASAELQAEQVFVVIANDDNRTRSVSSFSLTWEPDAFTTGHCGYEVHVYNSAMEQLFEQRIDGNVFSEKTRNSSYEVRVPGQPISNVNVIHLKIVPDYTIGNIKTTFTKVSARGV